LFVAALTGAARVPARSAVRVITNGTQLVHGELVYAVEDAVTVVVFLRALGLRGVTGRRGTTGFVSARTNQEDEKRDASQRFHGSDCPAQ